MLSHTEARLMGAVRLIKTKESLVYFILYIQSFLFSLLKPV